MTIFVTYCTLLLLVISVLCNAGLIKGRRNKHDESVETLLAVGLIAKALAESSDSPQRFTHHCPPPIQVTKVIPVPVHKERIVVLKDKECEAMKYHESRQQWVSHEPHHDSRQQWVSHEAHHDSMENDRWS